MPPIVENLIQIKVVCDRLSQLGCGHFGECSVSRKLYASCLWFFKVILG
jgi:hypothetical protein